MKFYINIKQSYLVPPAAFVSLECILGRKRLVANVTNDHRLILVKVIIMSQDRASAISFD